MIELKVVEKHFFLLFSFKCRYWAKSVTICLSKIPKWILSALLMFLRSKHSVNPNKHSGWNNITHKSYHVFKSWKQIPFTSQFFWPQIPKNLWITTIERKYPKISFYELTYSLWHYGLWSFQTGDTKLERFLPKNQHTQRKLLSFGLMANCQK